MHSQKLTDVEAQSALKKKCKQAEGESVKQPS